ncbi:hypothetical protein [Paenibacillus methanolicus]|uniref:Uncharacterized protein n=1 Tax=Paenibacillus methanolicus TaxID=582686 RepID=A0A5S5BU85_9BACL|nr:hypothetical protein [Paenibacillus methanolicus]TYP70569.1 hypothetical protein BCM02_11174 [Paenibacillus methanolicus]
MLNEEYLTYKLWEYERREVERRLELMRKRGEFAHDFKTRARVLASYLPFTRLFSKIL